MRRMIGGLRRMIGRRRRAPDAILPALRWERPQGSDPLSGFAAYSRDRTPPTIRNRDDVYNFVLNGVGKKGELNAAEFITLGTIELMIRRSADDRSRKGVNTPDNKIIDEILSPEIIEGLYRELCEVLEDEIATSKSVGGFWRNVGAGFTSNFLFAAMPVLFVLGALFINPTGTLTIIINALANTITWLQKIKAALG